MDEVGGIKIELEITRDTADDLEVIIGEGLRMILGAGMAESVSRTPGKS